jgi:hypothetical protein
LLVDKKNGLHAYDPVMGAYGVGMWARRSVEEWAHIVAGNMVEIRSMDRFWKCFSAGMILPPPIARVRTWARSARSTEAQAKEIRDLVQKLLKSPITTQIIPAGEWLDVPEYHQLYLNKSECCLIY